MLAQVLPSLGWEVISIDVTNLLGTLTITDCKFHLDCNMEQFFELLCVTQYR